MEFVDEEVMNMLNLEASALEMATIGYFQEKKGNKPKGSPIRVFATSDSGRPQTHIHLKSKDGKFCSCIKLDAPEYFFHDLYVDRLSNSQLEALLAFFKGPPSATGMTVGGVTYKLKTQWDYTILQWNMENEFYPEVCFPVSKDAQGYAIVPPMPDYAKINLQQRVRV